MLRTFRSYLETRRANVYRNEFDSAKLAALGIVTEADWVEKISPEWREKRKAELLMNDGIFRQYYYPRYRFAWPESLAKLRTALISQSVRHNLVVTAGKNDVTDWFIGANFSSGYSYLGIDSSNQAPAAGDTGEISIVGTRKIFTDRFRTNNVATHSFFFASTDNNGTWNAAVLAKNVSGAPIFFRTLFTGAPITKDSTKTETVDTTETIG